MGIVIRKFQDPDFNAIVGLEQGEKRNRYGACVFVRQSAALYPQTFLVADHNGTAVGYAIGAQVQDDTTSAWVIRLSVGRPYQGQGTGTALISRLIEELAARKVQKIFLSVAPANIPAQKIYGQIGFVKVAHTTGYFGEGEDRDIMRYVVNGGRYPRQG
jgi:ribosomal-protein-alanine N-acetyltransferase